MNNFAPPACDHDCCVECGNPLKVLPNGSRLKCCNGRGYWSMKKPLRQDQWYPVTKRGAFTAYIKPLRGV